ncbi:MAG: alpha-galactosidase [Herbinix sp.]|jgi:hypothetical protein|nr:alpha-galactosidase [Herbinix sp.]
MDQRTIYSHGNIRVEKENHRINLTNGKICFVYDLAEGNADISNNSKSIVLSKLSAEIKFDNGAIVNSKDLQRVFSECVTVEEQKDGFGEGIKLTFLNTGEDGYVIYQNFYAYQSQDYILMDVVVKARTTIRTNYVAPLSVQLLRCTEGKDNRFIFTPFDNDDFVRYSSLSFTEAKESYEVTSIFDNDTRRGMVVGSVTHDTWKTGICFCSGSSSELSGLTVYGGITSKQTRDTLPHGFVCGETVASPKILLGFFDDYRDGLEAYGTANGIIAPHLPWNKGIPMGWNSWSAVAKDINYDIFINASDYVKEQLQANSFGTENTVYINFDAGWNKLSEEQLISAARHVKNNGQVPGIYTTPFTFWGKDTTGTLEINGELYPWRELLLKDEQGNILPPIDGGLSIDPTHPANIMRLKQQFDKFREWGYQYVKMDFMTHGAVEGVHYKKDITTGIAAYNYGMQKIVDSMKEEIDKQEFFISLSIAPLFPSQYAHSRRISCDIFGTINFAEYMLNSLTYGWWMNDRVYKFNDPDHIVVYNSYNHLDPILYNEGLTRYISSAIAGTMMIDSDDFRIEESRKRTKEVLTNEEINKIAKAGITFRPVEGNTGDRGCDCFTRYDEVEKVTYLAVFNFSSTMKQEKEIELSRIGLDQNKEYILYDLVSKTRTVLKSKHTVLLNEAEPKLYKLWENK